MTTPNPGPLERIKAVLKGIMGLGVLVIAGVLLYACVSCSGDSHTYSAPTSFTVSNDAVAKLIQDTVAGAQFATNIDGSPEVNCTGETACTIAYKVQKTAGGLWGDTALDHQLIEPTRQIWKALFTDSHFQSGTITVSGPVTTVGGKSETSTYYTLACDRSAASQIDWDKVEGKGMRMLCNYVAQTQGLPGYTGHTPPGEPSTPTDTESPP
jgi:hypothetical protein